MVMRRAGRRLVRCIVREGDFCWLWVGCMVLETLELCRPNVMNENLGFKDES